MKAVTCWVIHIALNSWRMWVQLTTRCKKINHVAYCSNFRWIVFIYGSFLSVKFSLYIVSQRFFNHFLISGCKFVDFVFSPNCLQLSSHGEANLEIAFSLSDVKDMYKVWSIPIVTFLCLIIQFFGTFIAGHSRYWL
jgi:hypothetical protein